ncbi:snapalysin [Streptomyces sp. Amel2xC10]|uniref:snapalysin n=1 Tax=Streptomyces sp. Amel2xC10 TaxID=1305826 RepID=UPI000A090ED7|nr:snapalysin [Streptomyces sp. Amel2xC10]SMF78933.1 snapalysin [Streptomyces sp. Amel2xC10]
MKWSQVTLELRKRSRRTLALTVGLGLASTLLGTVTAAPASARTSVPARSGAVAEAFVRPAVSAERAADSKAFFEAVVMSVAKKQARQPGLRVATVYYNASQAPSFSSVIATAVSIWNGSVSNVKFQATSGSGDLAFREGNDPSGSYAATDGHGRGYIFLDYAQNRRYDPVRVAAHETGHALGLPDHYSGPCSELMSGGGPGPSCTNAYPNAAERSRVERLWANGMAKALKSVGVAR